MVGRASGPMLGVAAGALAVICCAGLPVSGALIGAVTLTGIVAVAGGALGLAALGGAAIVLLRVRRRGRSWPPGAGGPSR
jgi:hypothetical protein